MKVLTYRMTNELKLGVKTERGVLDVAAAASAWAENRDIPLTVDQLLSGGERAFKALKHLCRQAEADTTSVFLDEAQLVLGPCCTPSGEDYLRGNRRHEGGRTHRTEHKMPSCSKYSTYPQG